MVLSGKKKDSEKTFCVVKNKVYFATKYECLAQVLLLSLESSFSVPMINHGRLESLKAHFWLSFLMFLEG